MNIWERGLLLHLIFGLCAFSYFGVVPYSGIFYILMMFFFICTYPVMIYIQTGNVLSFSLFFVPFIISFIWGKILDKKRKVRVEDVV